MTKIYIYCLFDRFDNFLGVYSSLKSAHRDAISICNRGARPVRLISDGKPMSCNLVTLRNIFKGKFNTEVMYLSDTAAVKIYKTKIKE
tara:strand:- start:1289 stop:1552 length:264 start_codon:yes stop_codon:yes gene_type:complete